MSAELNDALAFGVCPACHSPLYACDIEVYPFNCPHCGKALQPDRGRAYFWCRFLFTCGCAFIWAWHRWHESFMIFTVGFYGLPLFIVWLEIERLYLPPRKFKRPESPFITLGI
jgi:hypothetical protein